MAGYRRVISYIYKYEQEERNVQCGCVKLYVREREWRIDLWLRDVQEKNPEAYDEAYSVYAYVLEGNRPAGIYLGQLKREQDSYIWKETLLETLWIQEGFAPERIRGICICQGEKIRYACEWDDIPIEPHWVLKYPEKAEPEEPLKEAEIQEYELQECEIQECEMREAKEQPIPEDRRQSSWEYLLRRFPVKTLIQKDGSAMKYIWLGAKDLQKLPRNCWILGNNSFLLHGYYQYGHLLLCRMDGGRQTEYYLAVPGICNEKETMMAGLFGFEKFHRIGAWENRQSEYGYWFRKIEDVPYDHR